jgi:acyl-CoA thioesterase I
LNYFIIHYISGEAFFSGIFLLIIAVALSFSSIKFIRLYLAGLTCAIGAVNIVVSATPLPLWIYIVLGILIIAQLICGDREKIKMKYKLSIGILLILASLLAAAVELPFWISPSPMKLKSKNIFVLGDSLSAGVGFKGEKTWSEIVAENKNCNVINKSVGGGTASSAIGSLKKINNINKNDLIIIEIGGNDLLNGSSAKAFHLNLEKLLINVTAKTENVIMLELPLPPLGNNFGRTQRELSSKFKVILIPKKYFSWVLTGSDSTVDGLHFSNSGQEKMARIINMHIVDK